jgi:hypothetical protein
MSPLAALYRLGLDITDVASMHVRFVARIRRANHELLSTFHKD